MCARICAWESASGVLRCARGVSKAVEPFHAWWLPPRVLPSQSPWARAGGTYKETAGARQDGGARPPLRPVTPPGGASASVLPGAPRKAGVRPALEVKRRGGGPRATVSPQRRPPALARVLLFNRLTLPTPEHRAPHHDSQKKVFNCRKKIQNVSVQHSLQL